MTTVQQSNMACSKLAHLWMIFPAINLHLFRCSHMFIYVPICSHDFLILSRGFAWICHVYQRDPALFKTKPFSPAVAVVAVSCLGAKTMSFECQAWSRCSSNLTFSGFCIVTNGDCWWLMVINGE